MGQDRTESQPESSLGLTGPTLGGSEPHLTAVTIAEVQAVAVTLPITPAADRSKLVAFSPTVCSTPEFDDPAVRTIPAKTTGCNPD